MAKKRKSSSAGSKAMWIVVFVMAIVAVATACMVFIPQAAYYKLTVLGSESKTYYDGLLFTFGNSDDGYKFNTVAFLGFFLGLMGTLLFIVLFALVGKKAKFAVLLPTLCFIAGAVLTFLSVKGFVAVNGDGAFSLGSYASGDFHLSWGTIVGGSLNCVGALVGVYGTYLALK